MKNRPRVGNIILNDHQMPQKCSDKKKASEWIAEVPAASSLWGCRIVKRGSACVEVALERLAGATARLATETGNKASANVKVTENHVKVTEFPVVGRPMMKSFRDAM